MQEFYTSVAGLRRKKRNTTICFSDTKEDNYVLFLGQQYVHYFTT